MAWFILVMAGVFEIGWAVGLKYVDGFSKPLPLVVTAFCMIVSVTLLAIALRDIPLGTGYAIWTGIGTAGAVLFGIFYFAESASIWRLMSIGLILLGVLSLKVLPSS